MLSSMDYIRKYTDLKLWEVVIYGGIVVCLFVIFFMIIGFFIGIISDYGRIFAFTGSTFVCVLYFYFLFLYLPIKILVNLYTLKSKIKFKEAGLEPHQI